MPATTPLHRTSISVDRPIHASLEVLPTLAPTRSSRATSSSMTVSVSRSAEKWHSQERVNSLQCRIRTSREIPFRVKQVNDCPLWPKADVAYFDPMKLRY